MTHQNGGIICNKKCVSLETAISDRGFNCNIIVSPLENKEILEQLKKLNMHNIYNGSELFKEYYFTPFVKEPEDYRNVRPFNHYESPYPDIREIHEKEVKIFDHNKEVMDIDFNIEQQFEYIKKMENINIIDWGNQKQLQYRYYYDNSWYSIWFFGEMLMRNYSDKLSNKLKNIGGSLWIKKM